MPFCAQKHFRLPACLSKCSGMADGEDGRADNRKTAACVAQDSVRHEPRDFGERHVVRASRACPGVAQRNTSSIQAFLSLLKALTAQRREKHSWWHVLDRQQQPQWSWPGRSFARAGLQGSCEAGRCMPPRQSGWIYLRQGPGQLQGGKQPHTLGPPPLVR
ncbi:hypothetical protein VTI74DRAFT_3521 [Chaetomium olivicolor]